MPLPKEHGAWALLYGPFVLAIAVIGRFDFRLVLLFVAISALFIAHEPLSKLVRASRHPVSRNRSLYWKRWLMVYLVAAFSSGTYLLWRYHLWLLIPLGLIVGLLLGLHLYLVGHRRERGVLGELLGVVGLTTTGPVTCYVLQSRWEESCLLIWILSVLYFAGGVFYVKMRVSRFIKTGERQQRVIHCVAYQSVLLLALFGLSWRGFISGWLLLAYTPAIVRAIMGVFAKEERLNIRRIGYLEVFHTLVFIGLFVVIWDF